ncbi:unnamed protein product [Trifolium pratense]|uniref:Uncharacterized protein n=1 Tax=Trifolium pratense TaxID=57577 RepID=A0ACB0LZ39_TRIPR|nr:unnamed protein product [Trifolium pratense]
MKNKMALLFLYSTTFMIGAMFLFSVEAEPVADKQALLDFLHNMNHSTHLNWNKNSSVCKKWNRVICNKEQSRVISLQLQSVGLNGSIPPNTLSRLSALQNLSLASNSITGFFPSGFNKLKILTFVSLQFNKFYGSLPLDFSVWKNLTFVDFSNNGFNGSIPLSVSNLTHLSSLILANNTLSGEIPDINIPSLKDLNLENNNLSGFVPKSLSRFPSLSFSGNNLTYVDANVSYPTNVHKKRKKNKGLKEPALLGIIIGGSVLGFLFIGVFLIVCYYEKRGKDGQIIKSQKSKEVFSEKKEASDSLERNKIVFFEGCNLVFDLEDLLRASAEVLGKGTFGTVYKASLEDATTVAVKRLKEVMVGKREFEQQMEIVGRIRHENVVSLRAYYYSKEEKLMVYDYYEQGSVSAMLHGKRGAERIPLNWESRLKIAIGVARGISHIHEEKLIHGNIKASNIFLNSKGYGCISDIGLATMIISPISPRARGYLASEVTETRKATYASDVYSFGVLLLELLTGKSPLHGGEEVVHLVRWVNSVVREEWTSEVFDLELLRYPNIEEEMVEMLQIGMACVVRLQDDRPKMDEVVTMVEEIHRGNSGNRPSSEFRSECSTPTPHVIETPTSLD